MYIAVTIDNKDERINLRIRADIKDDAKALAELKGFGGRGLTSLFTYLLVEAIKSAKRNEPELFADAKKRIGGTRIGKVAIAQPSNASERHAKRQLPASRDTRAVSSGRKR